VSTHTEIAIIGAGPYGLSIAAHLQSRGTDFRIFGPAMDNWKQMPVGMCLKSDGFSSNIADPADRLTMEAFCKEFGWDYAPEGLPLRLDCYIAYGLEFQKRFLPSLDPRMISSLRKNAEGLFELTLDDGEEVRARFVVMATGISHYDGRPAELQHLPKSLCTHSAAHHDMTAFKGRHVTILGAGASATDLAALLADGGAQTQLVLRGSTVVFLSHSDKPRTRWQRIRNPNFGLGPNLRSALCTLFPGLFRVMPDRFRLRVVRRHLGPAGGWFMREQVMGRLPILTEHRLIKSEPCENRLRLVFRDAKDGEREIITDHLIAATGYKVDLTRLPFLDPALRERIDVVDGSPRLSHYFESSVPGLYFVGLSSASSFGPVMRFVVGAAYTARRVAGRLAGKARKKVA